MWGEVSSPVLNPANDKTFAVLRLTVPLPFVPAICIDLNLF